jgi:hypothetical protein
MNLVELLPALAFLGIRNLYWGIILIVVVVLLALGYAMRSRRR